ncbi:MAG: hypothetical protein JF571_08220 [Asticcacaulis sp.]|nr:hypothetical protein [Asticcacaulis sp.]
MNDIWNSALSFGDLLQDALAAVNLLMVLIISLLIGLFQPKADKPALKAFLAVAIVYAIRLVLPALSGHRVAGLPDLRHVAPIVQLLLMYFFAYGVIAALGSFKTTMKFEAKKA